MMKTDIDSKIDSFEKMHRLYKQVLRDVLALDTSGNRVGFSLDYETCKKDNCPLISVKINGNWFTIDVDFETCDYYFTKGVRNYINKQIDNSIGFIEGYKLASKPLKIKIPYYTDIFSGGQKHMEFAPFHIKYYRKIIKDVIMRCFLPCFLTFNEDEIKS